MASKKSLQDNSENNGESPLIAGGLDISIIMATSVTRYIKFGSHKIWIKIRPHLYTPAFVDEYREHDVAETMVLGGLLEDWDLVYTPDPEKPNDKKKVPLTPEGIKMIPVSVTNAIWDEVMNTLLPNRRDQTDSIDTGSFA